jgi:hypothetical protein
VEEDNMPIQIPDLLKIYDQLDNFQNSAANRAQMYANAGRQIAETNMYDEQYNKLRNTMKREEETRKAILGIDKNTYNKPAEYYRQAALATMGIDPIQGMNLQKESDRLIADQNKQEMENILNNSEVISKIMKAGGKDLFSQLQPYLSEKDPFFKEIDPKLLQITNKGGIAYPVKNEAGKIIPGHFFVYNSNGDIEYKTDKGSNVTINQLSQDSIPGIVDQIIQTGIYDPTMYPTRNNARGNIDAALKTRLAQDGKLDQYGSLLQAGKFYKDAINTRAIPAINTAIGQAYEVKDALYKFKPEDKIDLRGVGFANQAVKDARKYPENDGEIWDKALSKMNLWMKEQKLSPSLMDFYAAVFYYIRESNRALTGSSATAQESYNQEAALFSGVNSRAQIEKVLDRSINTLKNAKKSRKDYYANFEIPSQSKSPTNTTPQLDKRPLPKF